MGPESRVASHRDISPSARRGRSQQHQERRYVLVEGSLISSTYEQANGKGQKAKASKITSWSIRADVVRKLDRGEPEPQAPASSPDPTVLPSDASDPAPF